MQIIGEGAQAHQELAGVVEGAREGLTAMQLPTAFAAAGGGNELDCEAPGGLGSNRWRGETKPWAGVRLDKVARLGHVVGRGGSRAAATGSPWPVPVRANERGRKGGNGVGRQGGARLDLILEREVAGEAGEEKGGRLDMATAWRQ